MPNNPINITNITPPRVPLTDARTGLISREWYRFFANLFQLVGNGSNQISLLDVQYGPIGNTAEVPPSNSPDINAAPTNEDLRSDYAELQKQVYGLEMGREPQFGTMAPLQQDNVPWLTFNTSPSPVPTAVGSMYWDGGTTMGVQATANVLIRIGESEYVYVKASSAITKGQVCYHTGAVGASGVITAAPTPLALADPNQIVGIAAESIALNGFGLIQVSGVLRGFNTTGSSVGETWADGDPLYYNPAYVGSMTKTKPSAPNQKTYLGEVINAATAGSGSMSIRISPGSTLGGTDSNVQFSALVDKNIIQYDSALGYWKNVAPTAVVVGTATNLAGGVAGSVPYQSAPDTTTFLGIGTAGQYLKVNSGATAPQWASPAALTKTDDTNVTLTLGGSASTALLNAASLTLGWTGQLGVSRGGTGVSTTPTNGQLLIGNGTDYTVANLTAGSGVTITNSAGGISISATGSGGTVTSVSVVSANGFAGTVATATTTPAITLSTSITGLLYGNGTAIAAATVSAPLTYSAGTLAITQATTSTNGYLSSTDWNTFNNKQPAGTYVTSVTGTSPIVSSGGTTPAISLASGYGDTQNPYGTKTANYVLAGPTTGAAAAPTFRALVAADIPSLSYVTSVGATAPITSTGGLTPTIGVTAAALTKVDDTNVTLTLGGSPTTALLAATSLTLGWTGQLAVSRGGTGLSSGTSGGIPYFSSTTAMTSSALLAANALMVGGGAGAAPSTITTGTGVVTALGVNTGTAGAFVVNGGALGTPSSGTVTNLTGTASININGTVGATTPASGAFTTLTTSSTVTLNGGTANSVAYLNASKVLTTSTNAYFDGSNLGLADGNAPTQRLNLYRTGATQTVMAVGNSNTGLNGSYFGVDTAGNTIISQTQALAIIFSTNGVERGRITSTGNFVAGPSAALATTATDGFLYVPTCAGTPTGTPTTITGMAPIVVNTTNNKLYFYSGGAWRDAGP
jgi:hypothetical protein